MAAFWKKSEDKGSKGLRTAVKFDSSDEAVLNQQIDDWVSANRPRLGEVLLDLGVVEPNAVENALREQAEAERRAQEERARLAEEGADPDGETSTDLVPVRPRVGALLMDKGHLDEISLAAALSRQFGVPLADLRLESPQPEAVELIPEDLAREHMILPIRIDEDGRVQVASADPFNVEAIRAITHHVGKVALRIGAYSEIERQLDNAYNVLDSADVHVRAFELTMDDGPQEEESDAIQADENAPVVQVVSRIITQAVRQRASDIHIEPSEHQVRVRYRIDGAMTPAIDLPKRMGPALTSRIKVMAELNIVERRKPQDGQFGVHVDGRPIDFRCSIVPTIHGEKTVLRLLDKTKNLISLNDLGMSPEVVERYRDIVSAPLGMMLCTGPTGSGKTTTLYATLNEVRDSTRNIVTIEDPVEYQFDGITQMPVTHTSGMTFAQGLKGILRQDPDTILVGEIRDEETARIAMQAALTGHLVLSSLHAVDSVAAVHRFTDMGIEPFLVSSALSAVVGQRLLRRICSSCVEAHTPSAHEQRTLERYADPDLRPVWRIGRGCEMCANTGFRGRVGVYEILVFTDTIRDLVVSRASHHEIRAAAMEEGMRTMQQQAFDMVAKGLTTVADVLRSVYAPGMDDPEADIMGELPPAKLEIEEGARGVGRGTPDSPPPSNGHGDSSNGTDANGTDASGADTNGVDSADDYRSSGKVFEMGPHVGAARGEGES